MVFFCSKYRIVRHLLTMKVLPSLSVQLNSLNSLQVHKTSEKEDVTSSNVVLSLKNTTNVRKIIIITCFESHEMNYRSQAN